ncbi:hypothetical protein EVAR_53792_1 [Eumeta japonica]|uniref:Uncharacterized protein n=1 Tax=Eumeta variegata TaxID=151549 RepID=A0A4C1XW99_EUMVA|nr:hypothetical protein EVAR_53792_1 [Eumeta japonica]
MIKRSRPTRTPRTRVRPSSCSKLSFATRSRSVARCKFDVGDTVDAGNIRGCKYFFDETDLYSFLSRYPPKASPVVFVCRFVYRAPAGPRIASLLPPAPPPARSRPDNGRFTSSPQITCLSPAPLGEDAPVHRVAS